MSNSNINPNQLNKINSDKFWLEDPKILIQSNKLTDFFPTSSMNLIEKLNALTRMGIYLTIILVLLTQKPIYLYICLILGALTVFIYKTKEGKIELYLNSNKNNDENNEINKQTLLEENCTKPTINNPFMNINLITDKKDKPRACKTWNNQNLKDKVEKDFNYNLYRDVSDLYGKSNSQRQYYTAPSTTIPNDQTAFAKWCFNTGPTCKENGKYCAPEYNPNTSMSHPFYSINDDN